MHSNGKTGYAPLSKKVCLKSTLWKTQFGGQQTRQRKRLIKLLGIFSICPSLDSPLSSQVIEADEVLSAMPGWMMEAPIVENPKWNRHLGWKASAGLWGSSRQSPSSAVSHRVLLWEAHFLIKWRKWKQALSNSELRLSCNIMWAMYKLHRCFPR